ncbi:MAG: VCBS repeat-containing protein, partial [Planctomycetales bacterium]|nr:VCBS repeat-containing protein [Planctomycetales bacterium]
MSATKILTRLLGRRKARKSRATLRRRRLLLESLQKREMLAADVSTGNEINSFPLETVTDLSFDEAASVRVLDIDRNGHPDIVSDKGIYLNNGNASSWTTVEFDGEVEDIADMDQDGDLDIVGAGAWYENASGDAQNWIRHGVGIRRDYGPRVVWDPYWDRFRYPNASERPTITGTIATDMDGDGDRDLVMSIADTYASELVNPYYDMVWYENKLNAGQEWEFHSLMPVSGTRVTQIARADLDGNNHEDIIVGFENGNVFYLDNSGTTLTVREVRNKDTDPDQTNGRVNGIDTADVDGDGSLDILVSQGLYYYRGNYTVYTARNDPAKSFEKTVVDEVRTSSHIRGVDINLDGKAELLGGDGNHLYWYDENGSSFDSFQVKGDASIRYQRDAGGADFDGDGDIDLVSVGRKTRIWWNRGGDLSLTSTDVSPDVIGSGQSHEMLQVVARHLGESGNPDLEVASLVFMFDDGTGNIGDNRMSTTEAQGIINELQVYLDDGDGTYSGADQLLTSLANVTLNNGVLTLVLPDGNAGTQLTAGEEKTYWVVLNTKSLAHEHGDLRMTLLTDQGDLAGVASAAEVRSNDTPVELAYTALVSAGIRSAGADLAITLDTSVTNSSGALYNGGRDDLLEISAYYSGAYDVELASIALMLDQGIGGIGEAPLSSSQANALIDRVRIYRDLGQGIGFVDDPSVAELVTTVDTLSLTGGVLVVNLPDGDPSVTFSDQETQTYWVVVDMASNAASARPRTFRMTHLTDESNDVRSIAELASNDSPRKVTDADDISVTVTAGKGVDLDVTRSFAPAIEGQSYTYTVTVQNNGPLDVTKAVVRDFVPDVLIAPVLTDIQVFGGAAGFQSPGLSLVTGIQWSDIVDIPVGGSIEYTVSGTIVAIDAGNQSAYNYTFHRTETALNFPYLDVDNSNDAYSDVINVQLDSRGSLRFQDSNVQLSEGDSNQGDMALGDVDGDGDLDLLIARGSNSYGASSQLLINDGLGNYSDSGLDFGVDGTSSVAMADLDGDGDLDLYIANVASTPFLPVPLSARDRVFFNDGNGNFTASGQELDKVSSYAALAGDLDNDGDIDIVTGSQVQLNDGTGQFTSIAFAYDTIEVSATAELADLDGDGDLDVVDTGSGYGDLQIYWNDGNGVFTSSNQNLPDEVYDVSVGDLDGDGDVDLFVNRIGKQYGSHPSPSMILVNDGKGNFEGDTIEVGGDGVEHISGEIADFDGDGDLD